MKPDPIALWVVPVGDFGGVARHVLDASIAGIPGWRLIVLSPEGPLADRLRAAGRPVLTGAFGPQAGLGASISTLRRLVRTLRPAVVHTHLAYADIVAAMALTPTLLDPRARGPWLDATPGSRPLLVSTEHGIAPDDRIYHGSAAKSAVMAAAHRVRVRAFDGLIAVSAATRAAMGDKWHPRATIDVIPNGIDLTTQTTLRGPGLRFASIARLSPEKGLDRLLDAFHRVRASHPDATLVVAGTGPEASALQARASMLDLGESVTFPGFVEASAVMDQSDVLVQLSVWENTSYTILDACAAGLGVVATPVGGNPEILPERCLVSAADVASITAAMIAQGLSFDRRPGLAPGWPTVAAMTGRIAEVYDRVRR